MMNTFGAAFHDFAGSAIVHSVGGVLALVGAICLGPRLGKYRNGKSTAIPGHNLMAAALGVFILWFGWFGFNPGSQLAASGEVNRVAISHVFLTTNLAAVCGGLGTMFTSWIKYGKPSFSLTLNGILAGLVAITAGCDLVSPLGSAIIGLLAGIILVFSIEFIDTKLHIDDPVGASSVHGVCGILTVMRTMPRMAAKVTTVIAMMRQGRFAMKLSFLFWNIPCFISWVMTMRMAKRLRKTEMRP